MISSLGGISAMNGYIYFINSDNSSVAVIIADIGTKVVRKGFEKRGKYHLFVIFPFPHSPELGT